MSKEVSNEVHTTSAQDQAEVAKLQKHLAQTRTSITSSEPHTPKPEWMELPSVSIDEGAHKYVLISATEPCPRNPGGTLTSDRYFVASKRGASYHCNVAEPLVYKLESLGFRNINVLGGGRIYYDQDEKRVSIFGYSYGFGKADHTISKSVVDADERFAGYEVTWSDEGY